MKKTRVFYSAELNEVVTSITKDNTMWVESTEGSIQYAFTLIDGSSTVDWKGLLENSGYEYIGLL